MLAPFPRRDPRGAYAVVSLSVGFIIWNGLQAFLQLPIFIEPFSLLLGTVMKVWQADGKVRLPLESHRDWLN